jgi:hypothetical protein
LSAGTPSVTHLGGREPFEGIKDEQALDEVDGVGRRRREVQVPGLLRHLRQRHIVWQRLVALLSARSSGKDTQSVSVKARASTRRGTDRPVVLRRTPHRTPRLLELVEVGLAREEGHAQHELGKDAADGPHVDRGRVGARAKQELRGSVPPEYEGAVMSVRRRKSRIALPSGQRPTW